MKKFAWIIFGLTIGSVALAQNVVTSFSNNGTQSAYTTSTRFVYTMGGGPRTGHYFYWRSILAQSTLAQDAIPFNGSATPETSIGSFFPITYAAKATASTSFVNTSKLALFTANFHGTTVLTGNLPVHTAATTGTSFSDSFTFTIPSGAIMTLNVTGGLTTHYFMRDAVTGMYITYDYGPTSFSLELDPGTYELDLLSGGSASTSTQSGTTTNGGTVANSGTVALRIAPGG